MKAFSLFTLTAGTLIAAGALIIGTSNVVAESGGMAAIGLSTPASGQDTSAAIDLTGTWQLSRIDTDGNQHQVTMQLKQDGSKLSGTLTGQRGSTSVQGSIKGNQVYLTMKLRKKVTLTGAVNGDKMSGTSKKGVAWSATRQ